MHEITCQGNGRTFGISCISRGPEILLLPALPSCNMNWNWQAQRALIYHRCAVAQEQRFDAVAGDHHPRAAGGLIADSVQPSSFATATFQARRRCSLRE